MLIFLSTYFVVFFVRKMGVDLRELGLLDCSTKITLDGLPTKREKR